MFKANFPGLIKIWGNTKNVGGTAPEGLPMATGLCDMLQISGDSGTQA